MKLEEAPTKYCTKCGRKMSLKEDSRYGWFYECPWWSNLFFYIFAGGKSHDIRYVSIEKTNYFDPDTGRKLVDK